MLKGLASVGVAFFLGDAARVTKKTLNQGVVVTFECTLEWVADIPEEPESINDEDDVAECTSSDGSAVGLYARDVEGFEHHDVVSLKLGEVLGSTPEGTPLYRVISVKLLRREEPALLSMAPNGPTMLLIGTSWADGKVSDSKETIMNNSEITRRSISSASYGTFLPTAEYISVNMPQKWSDAVQDCRQMRRDVLSRTPGANLYTYRMIFLPGGKPACGGWAGVAVTGCGKPSSPPRAGACWSMYRNANFIVQSHELGHNFGVSHAGAIRNGKWRDYGDPKAFMGGSYARDAAYSVANRYTFGWLKEGPGEVLTTSSGRYVLSSHAESKNYPGADYVGIRILCGTCIPQHPRHKDKRGDLIVSYAHGQIYVHLRKGQPGTEAWAWLSEGQVWQNEYQNNVVQVCSISGNLATVGISNTTSGAAAECSKKKEYYVATGSRNCPSSDMVLTKSECKDASKSLGYPFRRRSVSSSSRPAGCFKDKNGGIYYNEQRPSSPTWAHGVCKRQ